MTTAAPRRQTGSPTSPAIPRLVAATIGLLSVGAAVAAGHLVAGLVSPASSPFVAVGDEAIRLSPQPLVEFAKTTFGTADKPVLLTGIAVVMVVVAAVAGLASRRSPRPGVVTIVVLGLLGFAAVAVAPAFTALDVVAPAAAVAVGVPVFRRLHALALAAAAPVTPTPEGGVSRRRVLVGTSAVVGLGALAAGVGGIALGGGIESSRAQVAARLGSLNVVRRAPAVPAGVDYAAELGTTPFVTSNRDFYRIDTALRIPAQKAADWSLRIHGMVDRERTLRFEDLLARPMIEKTVTMTCVSNEVGGSLISTATFVGVPLRDLLAETGVARGAEQIFTTSNDGWTAGTPTDVVMEPDRDAMLAIAMNGEPLPAEHGFPVRMVVPGLYGFVSATKWITDMELTTFGARQSYWLRNGWAQEAPIKTESRIDLPRGFDTVTAGTVTVAGIAWSQPRGISKVEVRMDGGPWQPAELATEVSGATWRMWRTTFDLRPGSHTVQCRATDADGETQVEQRADPIPDGATGWPATIFTVR
ncbi:MAG: molybdopterin-dependent oxidoreductase [Pseudonocardia sp.]|uniref:molybdopterin-dependent oxidoreductase n=1 Tax=unclassified Pseudonocardia TaxID=2619320 RepID=UPI000AE083F0|nr:MULTISPECIES: molybdopterin-dependent oxidoreductase [unclassified Pseudonocardia]MBN9108979.1 molybdopterin-dependent oxidoreductase [Pseudonocardia sp.]